ncbi:kinesin-associated protein 3-like [Paramacrobiotus metropolitanus]|uniref:kinesin-associated protein 3-like n=1 Tax=Paramacrobiotus metropolitanus TaxID=2943436 RepID=UPI002445FE20|nr:kinesin-associated protein 3-like [Paramacrobiotus metropolitanus]
MNYQVVVQKASRGYCELHPSEPAVIVKYQVHATVLRADGTEAANGAKDVTKLIYFTNLADATDLKRVAKDAISKCAYLDPNRADELEQLLNAIRNRQKSSLQYRPSSAMRPLAATPIKMAKVDAKMSELPHYRSLLYSSLEDKILGSEMILQLCQKRAYMSQILRSEPIISGLCRLLSEDETRNLDLKINITRIFAMLSQLAAAPAIFAKNRIGGYLLQEISMEQQRYEKLKGELTSKQNNAKGDSTETEAYRRKSVQLIRKQDLFIAAAFEILFMLAKDVATQTKMVKKDIISILCRCAERSNPEVQIAALKFLLVLSVYVENMERFVDAGAPEKIMRVLDHQRSTTVCELALKLLFNFSLCPALRKGIIKKNGAKKIVSSLENPRTTDFAARLLYSLSIDRRNRRDMQCLELCEAVGRLVTRNVDKTLNHYLVSLAINLAFSKTCAADMIRTMNILRIMESAMETQNVHLVKLITTLLKYMDTFPAGLKECIIKLLPDENTEATSVFNLEALITLSVALEVGLIMESDFLPTWSVDIELISICQKLKKPPELFALVVFMGALASQPKSCQILCDASMMDWLCQKLAEVNDVQEEIAVQIGYALLKFVQYEPARLRVMEYPRITKILTDRTQQCSDTARALFEDLLFHLSSSSQEIHEAWKMERFRQYNGQWLRAIEHRREEGDDGNLYLDDFNDGSDEMDLVTKYGLNDLSDEMDEDEEDVEDMIERYSARSASRLSFRS